MFVIGFSVENLSYNWSIITYRDSNTNSTRGLYSVKLNLSIKTQIENSIIAQTLYLKPNLTEICADNDDMS